jgi:hypothetical protein
MLNSLRKMLVKPRFGMRRCSGIWPPSKPRIMRDTAARALAFVSAGRGLAHAGAHAAAHALFFSDAFFGARMLKDSNFGISL